MKPLILQNYTLHPHQHTDNRHNNSESPRHLNRVVRSTLLLGAANLAKVKPLELDRPATANDQGQELED